MKYIYDAEYWAHFLNSISKICGFLQNKAYKLILYQYGIDSNDCFEYSFEIEDMDKIYEEVKQSVYGFNLEFRIVNKNIDITGYASWNDSKFIIEGEEEIVKDFVKKIWNIEI
ncbi:MAG TPA: hypothetical protein PLE45_02895 [Spirochaetota bacterium]|nr:hypothetical protein [Spirochaetota bacterium]HOL56658.1 hypothetical protein [Spirochaetota bacterium]HPP05353.1 hypothetical protein [Spirochaetota bacterium]